jgi:hypothetical protein
VKLLENILVYEQKMPHSGQSVLLEGVVMLRQFGPWNKGQRLERMLVDLAKAAISDGVDTVPIRLTHADACCCSCSGHR